MEESDRDDRVKEDFHEFARLLLLTLVGMLVVGGIVLGTAWYLSQTWTTHAYNECCVVF
jgi:hypothetical protein